MDGELSYTVTTFAGEEKVKKVSVLQNYRLEVEQFGRCVAGEEQPAVTKEFSLANARRRILQAGFFLVENI